MKFLSNLNTKNLKIEGVTTGTFIFPKVPFLYIEGPILLISLLEPYISYYIKYSSLVCTNAIRMKNIVGKTKFLIDDSSKDEKNEENLKLIAKYSLIGGFDCKNNKVSASLTETLPNNDAIIPMDRAYIQSFANAPDISRSCVVNGYNLLESALNYQAELNVK